MTTRTYLRELNASGWWRAALVCVTAVLVAVFAFAGGQSAQGHDYLASTTPTEGDTIDSPLTEVSLSLSEPPLEGLDTGSYISVVSPVGDTVSAESVQVDGSTLSVPVTFTTPGEYVVTWQTVSSDGHPISGTYAFTWLSNGMEASATPSESAIPASPTSEPSPTTSAPAQVDESVASGGFIWWVVGLTILLGVGAGSYLVVRARRARDEGPVDRP